MHIAFDGRLGRAPPLGMKMTAAVLTGVPDRLATSRWSRHDA